MFKRLLAISLILALVLTNFSRFFVYAGFNLNRKYIATTLCENRDKPEMHCNGQCYLMKKLKQAAQKEQSQSKENQKNLFQEALLVQQTTYILPVKVLKSVRLAELGFTLPQRAATVFHPPRA